LSTPSKPKLHLRVLQRRANPGWGTLTSVRDLGEGEDVDVRAISLDDRFRDAGISRWNAVAGCSEFD